jgi:hypothetical protein
VSRRKTPHQKREATRSRRALDRAIIRAVRDMRWSHYTDDAVKIERDSTVELVGLCIARRRV